MFSIIIPTYNRRELLLKTIKSVISQTFGDFEIIIGDIEISSAPEEKSPERLEEERELFVKQVPPNKLTARDISELKIKDDPKRIIRTINSKTKLRRALTLCKGRAGKETLLKYIHERISELL